MFESTTRKYPYSLFLTTLLVLILTVTKPVTSQNCGCASDFCCSRFGYCGQTDAYCSDGCREGPCRGEGGGGDAVSLEKAVTPDFFNSILSQARDDCAGKGFYSYAAFIVAVKSYPSFGASISKREIAAFFAHVTHETEFMCYIEEINGPLIANNYCDTGNTNFPCAEGKAYYGRGPFQLSWNYNYGLCGRDLKEDLLNSPEKVAQDPVIAFKTAFWFWTTSVRSQFNQGFGATIRAINSMECSTELSVTAEKRIRYFREYCSKLGVEPGENLSCVVSSPSASPTGGAYCGCSPIFCCSKHGYCGITDDFCGSGCRSGPCRINRISRLSSGGSRIYFYSGQFFVFHMIIIYYKFY